MFVKRFTCVCVNPSVGEPVGRVSDKGGFWRARPHAARSPNEVQPREGKNRPNSGMPKDRNTCRKQLWDNGFREMQPFPCAGKGVGIPNQRVQTPPYAPGFVFSVGFKSTRFRSDFLQKTYELCPTDTSWIFLEKRSSEPVELHHPASAQPPPGLILDRKLCAGHYDPSVRISPCAPSPAFGLIERSKEVDDIIRQAQKIPSTID